MQVQSVQEVALLIREARHRADLSQQSLAELIGASRQWVQRLEAGVSGVEFGLVLRALRALGLAVDVRVPPASSLDVAAASPEQGSARRPASDDGASAVRTTDRALHSAPVDAPDIHAVLARHRVEAAAAAPPSAVRPVVVHRPRRRAVT